MRIVSLTALSLVLGLLWRAEIEWHGWEGLIWLSYFHWAVPLGVTLFIAWAAMITGLSPRQRVSLVVLLSIWAYIGYYSVVAVLSILFASGPSAMFVLIAYEAWLPLIPAIAAVIFSLVPAGSALIARICGIPVGWLQLFASIALFVAAWPIATLFSRDDIHALKEGTVVPLLVFGLGIVFLRSRPPGK